MEFGLWIALDVLLAALVPEAGPFKGLTVKRLVQLGKDTIGCGGYLVAGKEILAECLGTFQLGGPTGGAEAAQSCSRKGIHHSGYERGFWADDAEADVVVLGEGDQPLDIVDRDGHVHQFRFARRARIARCDEHPVRQRRLGRLPGQGMLAATASDDENPHGLHSPSEKPPRR